MATDPVEIEGLLQEPRLAADGSVDVGRFTLYDVHTTRNGSEVFLTSVLTAAQIATAAETRLLWTDQNVQRGIHPHLDPQPVALLPVGDGYPDTSKYMFNVDNADEMAEKLLTGQRLFLNPLIWNLRPGQFEASFVDSQLHIYTGRVFLPDSHHRHQAIVRAVETYREAPQDYPSFSLDHQFTVEIYFMDPSDEAEYFFEKNQLGKRAERSRAYHLSSQDPFAATAKRFAELAPSLHGNVNRVTDRLTSRNPQVVTLSTLRAMAQTVHGDATTASEASIENVAQLMATLYEKLAIVRPELAALTVDDRATARAKLLVDQAVMMHGYAFLMTQYQRALDSEDVDRIAWWDTSIEGFGSTVQYADEDWSGDYFSRENPLWKRVGVLQETKSGRLAVSNTRQTRDVCGRLLYQRLVEVAGPEIPEDGAGG
jgi:hypothetical protein